MPAFELLGSWVGICSWGEGKREGRPPACLPACLSSGSGVLTCTSILADKFLFPCVYSSTCLPCLQDHSPPPPPQTPPSHRYSRKDEVERGRSVERSMQREPAEAFRQDKHETKVESGLGEQSKTKELGCLFLMNAHTPLKKNSTAVAPSLLFP